MSAADTTIKPYTGNVTLHQGPLPKDPELAAKVMSDAAVKFSESFQDLNNQIKKGQNPLDDVTRGNLEDLKRTVRTNGYKHATIINLNPMPLEFGATNLYLRSIVVPACEPGMQYAKHCIRHWRHEGMYEEDGTRKFKAIFPIHLAAQFVREYGHKDNYGGGVIICEGDINPEKCGPDFEVETYDTIGRPITTPQAAIEYDEEGGAIPVVNQLPVKRKLHDLMNEARKARNAHYKKVVARMSRDWSLPEGRGKFNVTDVHRMMASVLLADAEIAKLPDFCSEASMEEAGFADSTCKACGNTPKAGAYKCVNCGNILSALEAYKDFAIEFDHAKMAMLTSDEMEEAELIKMEREDARKPKEAKGKKKE
jgi:hypothetical protein